MFILSYRLLLGHLIMLYLIIFSALHVCCVDLVVSTCQVIGWKDSPEDAC